MKYQTSLLRWAGLLSLALAVFASGQSLAATKAPSLEKRADVVTIQKSVDEGAELPAVSFYHDRHTEALQKAGKDCTACHQPMVGDETSLSFSFKGADTVKPGKLKDFYHSNCISCHADMSAGPVEAECRTCHAPSPKYDSDRNDISLDKSLHYKHVASSSIKYTGSDKNCGACHHVYDSGAKRLVWGENKEDSCRACHMLPEDKAQALKADQEATDKNGRLDKRPSLDYAAHQSCVNCHLKVTTAQKDAKSGPTTCAGCHSTEAVGKFAKEAKTAAGGAPRLERGQEDAYLLVPVADGQREIKGMMKPVSFNHKVHEAAVDSCRSCHHKQIDACSTCHSLEGKKEGNFVSLSQAMHKTTAQQSCIGCHNTQMQTAECAGCHVSTPIRLSQRSCATCHSTPAGVTDAKAEDGSLATISKEEKAKLAAATVAKRDNKLITPYAQNDIPEKVSIGVLSNEYQPSELPHRKIVNTLQSKLRDSRLASEFHGDDTTLCQGCHHNSPASKTPPQCVSCHAVTTTPSAGSLLPLKAAYHQQCMTCHARMNQKPLETECADCHKPRAN